MGVLSGKDIFNSKYITAVIIDSSNRSYFIPIKNVIGDYWLTTINNELYVFRLNDQIITYRQTLVRSFRWYLYTTDHYLPMSPKRCKELEKILEKNDLPRLNLMLFNILRYLGRREKRQFKPHRVETLVEELKAHEDRYSEEIQNLLKYLEHLDVDEIITPVRKMTEHLEDDFIATDPGFLGTVLNFYKRTDVDHKKLNNQPVATKANWKKPIALMAIVGICAALAWMIYDSGMIQDFIGGFTSGGGMFSFTGPPQATDAQLMAKYPSPEALKAAVDRGELSESSLSQPIKDMIKNVKTPNP